MFCEETCSAAMFGTFFITISHIALRSLLAGFPNILIKIALVQINGIPVL